MKEESNFNTSYLSALSKNSEREKQKLIIENIFYLSIIYLHYAIAVSGLAPLWTFCFLAPIFVARWMIGLHDIMHICKPQDVNVIIWFHLLILTPLSLGYREMRDIHMRHHAYTVTEHDPDLYHIQGNIFSAYLNVLFSPELSFYYWVKEKGVDKQLLQGILIRLILFMCLVYWLGWMSLWYFIPVRLAYGTGMFSISYPLHRKDKKYGTFQPRLANWLKESMRICLGNAAINTLYYHDIHHDYPKIQAVKLPEARQFYSPKGTRQIKRLKQGHS